MRSASLPTAPFFRELRADKERSKETPMKKHFVTFDSELRRLKSNKKPKEIQAYNKKEPFIFVFCFFEEDCDKLSPIG